MPRTLSRLGAAAGVAVAVAVAPIPAQAATYVSTFTMKTANSTATGTRTVSSGTHTINGKITVRSATACVAMKLVKVGFESWLPLPTGTTYPVAHRCGAGTTALENVQVTPPAGTYWLSLCEPVGTRTSCALVG